MIKMTITNAVISQGFDQAPALNFSNGENRFVRFRVGVSVYDKNAEKNRRYVNISIKAFGGLCSRIESMKLDAGSYVNISGRYDEETWNDKETQEKRSAAVLIADEIEYCHSGKQNGADNGQNNGAYNAPPSGGQYQQPPAGRGQQQNNGYGNRQNNSAYNAPPPGGQYQPPPAGNGKQQHQQGSFTGFEGFGGQNPYFPEG